MLNAHRSFSSACPKTRTQFFAERMAAGQVVLWCATQANKTDVVAVRTRFQRSLNLLRIVAMDRYGGCTGAAYEILETLPQLLRDGLDEARRKE